MKIPLIDPVFIQIQIWQPWIARQNFLASSNCLLVSNRSRITKQISKRIFGCRDNRKLPRKWKNTARGEQRSKSPTLIRAAECFRPLQVFAGVESVQNHETVLERGQQLSRKLRNTVLMSCMQQSAGTLLFFSVISRTADPFRDFFRDSGPERHL